MQISNYSLVFSLFFLLISHGSFFAVSSTTAESVLTLKNLKNEPIFMTRPTFNPIDVNAALNISFYPPLKPSGLLFQGKAKGNDVIMGIAYYSKYLRGFERFVGSLRHFNYTGHIILGINPRIPTKELNFLISHEVTLYSINLSPCDSRLSTGSEVKGAMRGKCTSGLELLKLEWSRFEMARQWLFHCPSCTGWAMVIDVRDTFFQANPFSLLGEAKKSLYDLFFVEEISPYSSPLEDPKRAFLCNNFRSSAHTVPCYGKQAFDLYGDRPVLCSGSVLGTRSGLLRFLNIIVAEFYRNNLSGKKGCLSPSTTDQWTMNYLYYHGYFGSYNTTVTIPWGKGPILTVGKACMTEDKKVGAVDIVNRGDHGQIVSNAFHDSQIITVPVIHQFDRCGLWMSDYLKKNSQIYYSLSSIGKFLP